MTTEWNKASPKQVPRQGSRMVNPAAIMADLTFLFAFDGRLF
jgi:hypothetical protein